MTADIDRLIAEKLMGWEHVKGIWWNSEKNCTMYVTEEIAEPRRDMGLNSRLWSPSTNAEDCLMAMEAMRKEGYSIHTIHIEQTELSDPLRSDNHYGCRITQQFPQLVKEWQWVHASSFTLAVSKVIAAALAGEQNET